MEAMHASSKTKDSETKMHVPGCHHRLLNTLQSMLRQQKIGCKEKFMIYCKGRYSAFVNSPAKGEGGRPQKLEWIKIHLWLTFVASN